jgi:hypothetical protein
VAAHVPGAGVRRVGGAHNAASTSSQDLPEGDQGVDAAISGIGVSVLVHTGHATNANYGRLLKDHFKAGQPLSGCGDLGMEDLDEMLDQMSKNPSQANQARTSRCMEHVDM